MVVKNKDQMELGWFKGLLRRTAKHLLDNADIKIDGERPEDLQVNNDKLYIYLGLFITGLNRKSLGEAYMKGLYDVEDLSAFIEKSTNVKVAFNKFLLGISSLVESTPFDLFSSYSVSSSKKDVRNHYDRGLLIAIILKII